MPEKMKEFIAEKQNNKGKSVTSSASIDKHNVKGDVIFLFLIVFFFFPQPSIITVMCEMR